MPIGRVIAELLMFVRSAAVRAFGRRGIARLRQAIVPVVDIGGAIALAVDDIADLAVRRIGGADLIRGCTRPDRGFDLLDPIARVIAVAGAPVGRPEERRVGIAWVSACSARWWTYSVRQKAKLVEKEVASK